MRTRKPSVTVTCWRCRQPFEAPNEHYRCCPACKAAYAQARRDELRAQTALRAGTARRPRQAPYIYHPDFTLHLDAMRAELKRATSGEKAIYITPGDPAEISSFRVANQRRGSGNRPRSARA
jgi:hypothetical protein